MAGTLSLLLGGRVRAAVSRCGFATRGVAGPGPVDREPDPDSDWEPEERELQELESTLKRQKKAIRFQKIRRHMEAPGAPPRTLTWESMEQIRYLHKEFAEIWTVPRLAEGFDVSTDVIRRVLKSKFVPSLEQKLKQDQKVLERAGLAHAPPRLPAGHSVSGALLVPGEASSKGQSPSTALRAVANTPGAGSPRRQKGRNPGPQGPQEEGLVPEAAAWARQRELAKPPTRDCTGPRRKGSQLSSDEKLEDWKAGGAGAPNFSSRVVQRGREFFDSNGNFLYRI